MRITHRPLPEVWPTGSRTPENSRKRSAFRAGHAATLKLLQRELEHLGASATLVLEAGYREGDIRLDGMPRSDAKLRDPAVIVSFESRHGPLRYGCDLFTDHTANLRAVALTLEHLRAVDRYGVSKRGEQYQGWRALPAAGESMSMDDARNELYRLAGLTFRDANPEIDGNLVRVYRTAAMKAHPDKGGSRQDWADLQRAKAALSL